jgi:hypothetical protein
VPRSIDPSYEKTAIGFFFHHYAEGSHVKYLKHLFRPDANSTVLYKTVAAVSLVSFSFSRADPRLQRDAKLKYAQALDEVNLSLQGHPKTIGNDVVASILLLGLFVALSSGINGAPQHWSIHVNGALSVMMLDAGDQFSCPIRRRLLYHVLSMKQIDCMQRGIVIPSDLMALYHSLLSAVYQTQFWEILHELALLRAASSANEFARYCDAFERFDQLNERIAQLRKDLPAALDTSAFQDNLLHETMGFHLESVRAHNTLRMMQLSALEIYGNFDMFAGTQHTSADRLGQECPRIPPLIENISAEILGSVALWCDLARRQKDCRSSLGAWGQSFIWPLVMVGKCPLISTSVKNLASQYLATIAEVACLPEALEAAVRLKSGSLVDGWSHALYLG